jgi:antitoxin component of MazEF toxin-antitoxin module
MKSIAKKLQLHSGSEIELDVINKTIVISKADNKLDLLLEHINPRNIHDENFTDDSNVGNESW